MSLLVLSNIHFLSDFFVKTYDNLKFFYGYLKFFYPNIRKMKLPQTVNYMQIITSNTNMPHLV